MFRRSFIHCKLNSITSSVTFLVLNLLVAIYEIFEDVLKAHIGAREKSKEAHEEDEKVFHHSTPVKCKTLVIDCLSIIFVRNLPGAVVPLGHRVYDRRRHQSQS